METLIAWSSAPPRVIAQIENQPLHPLAGQFPQVTTELAVRLFAKLGYPHVASLRIEHERRRDGWNLDLVAQDFEINQVVETAAPD